MEIKSHKQDEAKHCLTETLVGVLKNEYASDTRVAEISKKLLDKNQQAYKTLTQAPLCDKEKYGMHQTQNTP